MNSKLISYLQELVLGLSKQILARIVQCEVFKFKGFEKLYEKYCEHLAEERKYLQKTIEHIINLGGEVKLKDSHDSSNLKAKSEDLKIYENPIEYLKHECELSENGLNWLKDVVEEAKTNPLTYDFLFEYYKDEQEDLNWTKKQLNLIKVIGEENWIINQI